MVCENIYICDGQFRDMSDFVTSLQATFDRKVTKPCESVKTQRRICKCNCKWKLPKDVKWRNLQISDFQIQISNLGFSTLGGFDPEVSRNPFLNCPQMQLKYFRNRNKLNFLWFSYQMGHFFSKLTFSVLRHSCKCYFENFYTSHEKINDSIRAPSKSRTRQTFLSIFIFFI